MRQTYRNPNAATYAHPGSPSPSPDAVLALHRQLPGYGETPLHELPSKMVESIFAPESKVPRVFVKDEGERFAARSFKILGASVAVHYALCTHLGLAPESTTISAAAERLAVDRQRQIEIVTCSDGNWGAAVARCAALYLSPRSDDAWTPLAVTIFLPRAVDEGVAERLRDEGPHVAVSRIDGDYDDAIETARRHTDGLNGAVDSHLDGGVLQTREPAQPAPDDPAARAKSDAAEQAAAAVSQMALEQGAPEDEAARVADEARERVRRKTALLLLDTSFAGFAAVPGWVTAGYATSLREVDAQLEQRGAPPADLVVCSVGVGSWAASVVAHFKQPDRARKASVVTVEAEAAPSLLTALHRGAVARIDTRTTIMEGMNCGTTSALAWPALRDGVDAGVVVNDAQAHAAVEALGDSGVKAGPCGAAPLAALRRLAGEEAGMLDELLGGGDDRGSKVVVLLSSEGARPYTAPK